MDQKTYNDLIDKLIKYSEAYYKNSISLVSDEQFDMMLKEAEKIEKEHPDWLRSDSPTLTPGSDLNVNNENNSHGRPMLSLENTYNREDVTRWYLNMEEVVGPNPEVVVEYKYDGNSAAIRFDHGKVIKSLTRGNGQIGEDITANIETMSDVNNIKSFFSGEARGEIIMSKEEFKRLNVDNSYANARNLAAGTIKLKDPEEFKTRQLWFYAYWLENSKNKKHTEDLEQLKALGFRVGKYYICHSVDELMNAIEQIEKEKPELPVEIDGAVMKLNDKVYWDELGNTSKFPRWAKAFKYHQQVEETEVLSIDFQVGRSGKVTPVANLNPVLLDGSTVSRATLNNADFLKQIDVRVGDFVYVQKAAAIIPQIIGVNLNRRKLALVPTSFPSRCPECGTTLIKDGDKVDLFCPNETCPSRIIEKISYYTHTLEIDGFGDEIIERFHFLHYLNSIIDLYHLKDHREELIHLDRLGEKSIDKLISNIEESKKSPGEKLLAALGIKGIGIKMAKLIMKKYQSIDDIMNASLEDLSLLEGIGDIKAKDIVDSLHSLEMQNLINQLKNEGVNMISSVQVNAIDTELSGKSFCITGALSMPRKEYEILIEQAGGKNVSSVTSKTDYLVTNDTTSGSSKNKKAHELGKPIIDEKELRRMLGLED
jgi:DNA ligase (NAD+)